MNIWTIALSSIKERVRRFSFWGMAALALVSAFLFVPKNEIGGMHVLTIEPETFLQGGNPTWIPIAVAMVLCIFLPLAGFAYVRGMVNLDRSTGTMDMLLASGVGRFRYVFGKLLAGFILLLMLLGIVMCGSLITMLISFHGQFISIWAFVSPFLTLVPGLLFVSAFSLVLETAAIFRRGNSNALAMFLFVIFFFVSLSNPGIATGRDISPAISFDFTGIDLLDLTMAIALFTATGKDASEMHTTVLGGSDSAYTGKEQLFFSGIPKDINVIINMLIVVAAALLLAFIAALLLEKRPVAIKQKKTRRRHQSNRTPARRATEPWRPVSAGRYNIFAMMKNEIRRMLGELHLWWHLTVLGLWVASWIMALDISRGVLLPILFGLAILPLSRLGSEEQTSGVEEWLLGIPGAPLRQSIASMGGSVLFCLLLILPVLIRSLAVSLPAALVILSLSLCIPLLGLLLGTFTKTERPFQLLLILFLYMVLNSPEVLLPTAGGIAVTVALVYLGLAGISIIAVIGQKGKMML